MSDEQNWPSPQDLYLKPYPSPETRRASPLVLTADAARLNTLSEYLDPDLPDEVLRRTMPELMQASRGFDPVTVRTEIRSLTGFDASRIVPYPYRPLDVRCSYRDQAFRPLFSRFSRELIAQSAIPNNRFLIVGTQRERRGQGPPLYVSNHLCDGRLLHGPTRHFPSLIRVFPDRESSPPGQETLFDLKAFHRCPCKTNLSVEGTTFLKHMGFKRADNDARGIEALQAHLIAIGYAPAWLAERERSGSGELRFPLPDNRRTFIESANLGRQLIELLDPSSEISGVTTGVVWPEMAVIACLKEHEEQTVTHALTAGWGSARQSSGHIVVRDYNETELAALEEGARALGLKPVTALNLLGDTTVDVYLNETAWWTNIPGRVWHYRIGGHPVFQTWLRGRAFELIGRELRPEELREATLLVRRLAALLLKQPFLNRSYKAVKKSALPWHSLQSDLA